MSERIFAKEAAEMLTAASGIAFTARRVVRLARLGKDGFPKLADDRPSMHITRFKLEDIEEYIDREWPADSKKEKPTPRTRERLGK